MRTRPAPRCGCCGTHRRRARRLRSTTGCWAAGSTRSPNGHGGCRGSSSCWCTRGCCSCGRCCRWIRRSWVEAHVAAFEFFGGCPARIVPDNLKTGVIKPDLYDPKINKAFGEFAGHYGCLVDPARAAKPRDKATVERHVPYARDSFFAGRAGEFESLAAHAGRRAAVVPAGREPSAVPTAWNGSRPRPCSTPEKPTLWGVLPAPAVRAGVVVDTEGRP